MNTCPNCDGPLPASSGTRQRVWCSDRCRKAAARRGLRPNGREEHLPPLPPVASIAEAIEGFLAVVDYPPEDPRAVVAQVARRMAAEMDVRPSAMLARELLSHLQHLGMAPNDPASFVDELRARRAQRRAEGMLNRPASDAASDW